MPKTKLPATAHGALWEKVTKGRGEHDCWVGALLGDNASCIISSASYMASKEHKQTTKLLFLNLLFF